MWVDCLSDTALLIIQCWWAESAGRWINSPDACCNLILVLIMFFPFFLWTGTSWRGRHRSHTQPGGPRCRRCCSRLVNHLSLGSSYCCTHVWLVASGLGIFFCNANALHCTSSCAVLSDRGRSYMLWMFQHTHFGELQLFMHQISLSDGWSPDACLSSWKTGHPPG